MHNAFFYPEKPFDVCELGKACSYHNKSFDVRKRDRLVFAREDVSCTYDGQGVFLPMQSVNVRTTGRTVLVTPTTKFSWLFCNECLWADVMTYFCHLILYAYLVYFSRWMHSTRVAGGKRGALPSSQPSSAYGKRSGYSPYNFHHVTFTPREIGRMPVSELNLLRRHIVNRTKLLLYWGAKV